MSAPLPFLLGIRVYFEKRTQRIFVGLLKKLEKNFFFQYEEKYLHMKESLPLSTELPLTSKTFLSERLFSPFLNHLSRDSLPLCEEDSFSWIFDHPFISSHPFIFEPYYKSTFTSEDLLSFRKSLGLTVKEFATCFEFSPAAITRIERKQSSGKEILKRVEIYVRFPEVTLSQIKFHGNILHSNKQKRVEFCLRNFKCKSPCQE